MPNSELRGAGLRWGRSVEAESTDWAGRRDSPLVSAVKKTEGFCAEIFPHAHSYAARTNLCPTEHQRPAQAVMTEKLRLKNKISRSFTLL
jgi:hypothetical protein